MPVLEDWNLTIELDQVLRGQGADPTQISARNPRIVQSAEWALKAGIDLIQPKVLYETLDVDGLKHERLVLKDGSHFSGRLVSQHLSPASSVIIVLATIGEALERRSAEVSTGDLVLGLALDGLGSAAVETLANECCKVFERKALELEQSTSIPISPGMLGWPVEIGQREIFEKLDPKLIGVSLTGSMMMIPQKSLTFVLGMGENIEEQGISCDYCSLRETCRYQDHYPAV